MADPRPTVVLLGHSSTREHFTYGYGLARVAAYAQKVGIEAEFRLHGRRADDDEDEDLELIAASEPAVVGLSAFLWNLPRVIRLVARIRERLPRTLIVLGGPSVLGYETYAPTGPRPDYMIVGEGEIPFAGLLQAHFAGELDQREAEIGSLVSFRSGAAHRYPDALPFQNLDELGSPYLMGLLAPPGDTLYWETSRGCPYKCSFCVLSTKVNKMRYAPVGFLEEELRWAMDRGIYDINICDAAINYHADRLDELTAMMRRVDPDGRLFYTFALHSDYLNERQIRLLSRLRIKQTTLGLNSITPSTFKDVKRKIVPERFAAAVERLSALTRPVVSVVMGLPGETVDGFARTLEFCDKLAADIEIFELKVIPETTYFDRAAELGIVFDVDRQMNVVRANGYDEDDLDRMRTLATAFQSARGRWRQAYFTGEHAHLSGGAVGELRRALVALGVLEAPVPFERDGFRFIELDAQRRHGAVSLVFRHDGGDTLTVLLAPRTDQERAFAKSMLFNVSYAKGSDGRDPSPRAIDFLRKLHRLLCDAERQGFATELPPASPLEPASPSIVDAPAPAPGRRLPTVGQG